MVLKRYGKTPAGRIGAAAVLKALGVLVRRHPKTALEMVGAGLGEAGRVGFQEVKAAVMPSRNPQEEGGAAAPAASPNSPAEMKTV
ncbi:hypothetical protein [Neorhizobium alkalisoli]|uniref:hypothetical protein n=1 Tax=Neorhizobium alkalisoli TaxID=528178 RepID=UPI001319F458|nr:hypothetical protein [Neorhizobium alkalisoli]